MWHFLNYEEDGILRDLVEEYKIECIEQYDDSENVENVKEHCESSINK